MGQWDGIGKGEEAAPAKAADGYMRLAMPEVSAWIDALRDTFGAEVVTEWIRAGRADGTFHASENGHEVGAPTPPAPNAISLAEMVIAVPEPATRRRA